MATAEELKQRQRRADLRADLKARQAAERPATEGFARTVDDLMRSAASGMTFGMADEIAALLSSVTGVGGQPGGGGDYAASLEAERARDEAIPLSVALPGEIAGGLATGTALARGAAALAPRAVQAFTSLPRYVQAPLAGAGTGAAYGFGSAENGIENRAEAAAAGGALGAGAGAVAYPVMRGLEGSVAGIRNIISNRVNPEGAVRRGLAGALRRDNLTPARAQRRLDRLGDEAVIADISPNVRGYARGATTVPGPAKTRADLVLQNRAAGESARIGDQLAQTLNPKNYFAAQDDLFKALRDNAGEAYERAYTAGPALRSDRLTALLNRPIVREAIEEARDLAAITGDELAPSPPGAISTAALDDVKRGLDRVLEQSRNINPNTGRLNKRGAAIADLRNQILEEADALNPAYAAARRQYAGDFEAVQALRQGRQFQRMAPEEITRFMSEADEGAKEAFRSGAARSMIDLLERPSDTATASNRLFGNKAMRRRLREIFPDRETYRQIEQALRAEMRFGRTRNNLLSGSDTAVKLAEQGDVGLINEAVTREGGFLGNLARGMYQRATAPNEDIARLIAQMTLNRNPEANRAVLDRILPLMQRQAASQATRESVEDAIIRSLAQIGGTETGRRYRRPDVPAPEIRMANGD